MRSNLFDGKQSSAGSPGFAQATKPSAILTLLAALRLRGPPALGPVTLLGVADCMSAAEILDDSIHEEPRSKPNERKGPAKEQSANVPRTSLRCLPQHRRDQCQHPPETHNE